MAKAESRKGSPGSYEQRKSEANSSRYTGVTAASKNGKWRTTFKHKKDRFCLGTFRSEIEAARVWDIAAIASRKNSNLRLNLPHEDYSQARRLLKANKFEIVLDILGLKAVDERRTGRVTQKKLGDTLIADTTLASSTTCADKMRVDEPSSCLPEEPRANELLRDEIASGRAREGESHAHYRDAGFSASGGFHRRPSYLAENIFAPTAQHCGTATCRKSTGSGSLRVNAAHQDARASLTGLDVTPMDATDTFMSPITGMRTQHELSTDYECADASAPASVFNEAAAIAQLIKVQRYTATGRQYIGRADSHAASPLFTSAPSAPPAFGVSAAATQLATSAPSGASHVRAFTPCDQSQARCYPSPFTSAPHDGHVSTTGTQTAARGTPLISQLSAPATAASAAEASLHAGLQTALSPSQPVFTPPCPTVPKPTGYQQQALSQICAPVRPFPTRPLSAHRCAHMPLAPTGSVSPRSSGSFCYELLRAGSMPPASAFLVPGATHDAAPPSATASGHTDTAGAQPFPPRSPHWNLARSSSADHIPNAFDASMPVHHSRPAEVPPGSAAGEQAQLQRSGLLMPVYSRCAATGGTAHRSKSDQLLQSVGGASDAGRGTCALDVNLRVAARYGPISAFGGPLQSVGAASGAPGCDEEAWRDRGSDHAAAGPGNAVLHRSAADAGTVHNAASVCSLDTSNQAAEMFPPLPAAVVPALLPPNMSVRRSGLRRSLSPPPPKTCLPCVSELTLRRTTSLEELRSHRQARAHNSPLSAATSPGRDHAHEDGGKTHPAPGSSDCFSSPVDWRVPEWRAFFEVGAALLSLRKPGSSAAPQPCAAANPLATLPPSPRTIDQLTQQPRFLDDMRTIFMPADPSPEPRPRLFIDDMGLSPACATADAPRRDVLPLPPLPFPAPSPLVDSTGAFCDGAAESAGPGSPGMMRRRGSLSESLGLSLGLHSLAAAVAADGGGDMWRGGLPSAAHHAARRRSSGSAAPGTRTARAVALPETQTMTSSWLNGLVTEHLPDEWLGSDGSAWPQLQSPLRTGARCSSPDGCGSPKLPAAPTRASSWTGTAQAPAAVLDALNLGVRSLPGSEPNDWPLGFGPPGERLAFSELDFSQLGRSMEPRSMSMPRSWSGDVRFGAP